MKRLAKKISFALLLSASVCSVHAASNIPGAPAASRAATLPEWSVLVFMNGKNNLEDFVFPNWRQISNAGSSDKVSIAVELGRLGHSGDAGGWAGVKRFVVTKGMTADEANAISDPQQAVRNSDMGDIESFREFLAWGKQYHPAKHYMVVVWNHGQGWRARSNWNPTTRSVSFDEETGHALYNVDVTNAIHNVFGDEKVDIAGFDACLMANVENAYELRQHAQYLVGSEELEPGAGWDYGFLGDLVKDPTMTAANLSKSVVAYYKAFYANDRSEHVTLSAVDLGKIDAIVSSLDKTTAAIESNASAITRPPATLSRLTAAATSPQGFDSTNAAREARAPLRYYQDYAGGAIDLAGWLDNLAASRQADSKTVSATKATSAGIRSAVLANYHAGCSGDPKSCGDNGLSIVFPRNSRDYAGMGDASGYDVTNAFKPVSFVKETGWPKFLHDVMGIPLKL